MPKSLACAAVFFALMLARAAHANLDLAAIESPFDHLWFHRYIAPLHGDVLAMTLDCGSEHPTLTVSFESRGPAIAIEDTHGKQGTIVYEWLYSVDGRTTELRTTSEDGQVDSFIVLTDAQGRPINVDGTVIDYTQTPVTWKRPDPGWLDLWGTYRFDSEGRLRESEAFTTDDAGRHLFVEYLWREQTPQMEGFLAITEITGYAHEFPGSAGEEVYRERTLYSPQGARLSWDWENWMGAGGSTGSEIRHNITNKEPDETRHREWAYEFDDHNNWIQMTLSLSSDDLTAWPVGSQEATSITRTIHYAPTQ